MAHRNGRSRRALGITPAVEAAQQRHEELMRIYRSSQAQPKPQSQARGNVDSYDMEVLRRNFQFIRDEEADLQRGETDWEVRMSVRYYRKLFREYALADLSRYKEGKVGLRWRTEMEVVAGKGQFVCGNKVCDERRELQSYELLFAYMEEGQKKRCLVKVRVCEECARKLFYRKLKENKKKMKRELRKKEREKEQAQDDKSSDRHRKRRRNENDTSDSDSSECSDHRRSKRSKAPKQSIHSLCTEINSAEAKELAGDAQPRGDLSNEDKELTKLLL